jgi:hypothetical protein
LFCTSRKKLINDPLQMAVHLTVLSYQKSGHG